MTVLQSVWGTMLNEPWELYDRDAIASAAHFLGYEGRWRFLLPQPGPASSLVNAEGQNKYQEKSLWINEWFFSRFFSPYQYSKLLIIKWSWCFLFWLLWLLSQLALNTMQWKTCQLFVLGWFWDSRHQWFAHISITNNITQQLCWRYRYLDISISI